MEAQHHCGFYCFLMSCESSLESFRSYFRLIRAVHTPVFRYMLFGILVQPGSHVGPESLHQSSSGPLECSKFCTLSQKYLNLLDNQVLLTDPWSVLPVDCSL